MRDGSFKNVRFFVAGDSTFAGLTAIDLARQGIGTRLIAAPDSLAVGIAARRAADLLCIPSSGRPERSFSSGAVSGRSL